MNPFQFKPLQSADLLLIHLWFQEPTIKHWYARDKNWTPDEITEKYQPRILGNVYVPSFIVYLENKPIGFIQYYILTDFSPEGICDNENLIFKQYQPSELAGIDLFIAIDAERGKGLGVALLHQFIDQFLSQNFKAVIVDPQINNLQAIRCYEKAGFINTTFSQDSNYLVMIK